MVYVNFKNENQSRGDNFKEWIRVTTKSRKDFKKDSDFYFHLLNVITPIFGFDKAKLYVETYELNPEHSKIFERLCNKFNEHKNPLVQERLFYVCMDRVSSDDLKFYKGKSLKIRYIQKNELIFILKTICSAVYRNIQKDIPTKLAYKYFLDDKTKASYITKTTKSLDSNKLAHILNVLEKYKLIHRKKDNRSRNIFFVGKQNPLYLLKAFKDIEEANEIELSLEQQNRELKAKIEMFEEVLSRTPNRWSIDRKPVKRPDTFDEDFKNLIKRKCDASKKPQVEATEEVTDNRYESITSEVDSTRENWKASGDLEYY
jgi:hypothetical protein